MMAEVKVLVEGIHEKGKEKLKASSTISLIKSDKNILVDTGSFTDEPKIIKALAKEGLKPKDIDVVVLTHLHIDHTRNTNIFKNAVLYVRLPFPNHPGSKWDINSNTVMRVKLDGLEITKDVKIISTPGHAPTHSSVIVQTDKGTIVVAGDAVPRKEGWGKPPYPQWNDEEFMKSQKKIAEVADYIIPGHGGMFKVK